MVYIPARWWRMLPVAVVLVFPFRSALADEAKPSAEALEFFEKKIRPLLVNNCYNCHSADNKPAGGLRVDDRNGLLAGGGRGAAVVVGNPDESVLIRAVLKTDAKLKMPPDSQLTEDEINDLRKWITVMEGPVKRCTRLSEKISGDLLLHDCLTVAAGVVGGVVRLLIRLLFAGRNRMT